MKCVVIVPTLNAAADWVTFCEALKANIDPGSVVIVDSASSDETLALAHEAGFKVLNIQRHEFDHGGTRQFAVDSIVDYEIAVFLTQDALLSNAKSIQILVDSFEDPEVGAAYGRQLPRHAAGPIEIHARLFNYLAESNTRSLDTRQKLGFKSIFISNSFSAYRISALKAVGGFPRQTIFGEDTITAARLLLSGWKIAYVADAHVYHSHSYTWRQEFRRYFDIGVLHTRESWLVDEFGGTGGEGARFVRSELRHLWPRYWWLIPSALIRTALKLAGYRLGKMERHLSLGLKRRLSMNRSFWK